MLAAAALVAVAAGIAGCANDETVETVDAQSVATIDFVPVINNTKSGIGTRHVDEVTNSTFNEFDVWAFKSSDGTDDVYVMGEGPEKGFRILKSSTIGLMPTIIGDATGIWGYANLRQVSYWPDGSPELKFYGLSPAPSAHTTDGLTMTMTKASPSFTYEAKESDGPDHSMQRDIIVTAKEVSLTKVDNRNGYDEDTDGDGTVEHYPRMAVPLTFRHALSQVVFEAKLEENVPNFEVNITSVRLCHIYKKGTCVLNTDNAELVEWEGIEKGSYSLNIGSGKRLTTTSGNDGNVTETVAFSTGSGAGSNDNLMVIPQAVTPWVPTGGGISDADGAYLEIGCTITQNGINLLSESSIYAPLPGYDYGDGFNGWKAGVRYKYTLTFGLGYSSTGQENGYPIKFSVTTTDWATEATGSGTNHPDPDLRGAQ